LIDYKLGSVTRRLRLGRLFLVRFSWVLLTAPLAYQALWASVQEMPETMAATAAMTSKIRIAV